MNIDAILSVVKFDSNGLVPVVAQDCETGDVLMVAYMNKESLTKTLETGKATYWSRSRKSLWLKGESSGNIQVVRDIFVDCDGDTLVIKIEQLCDNGKSKQGASCHTGHRSCFYRKLDGDTWKVISTPLFDPEKVYGKKA